MDVAPILASALAFFTGFSVPVKIHVARQNYTG
jgi:hypothetical protein